MKLDQPRKRQIIISIDDWCDEPFIAADKAYFDRELSSLLFHYDVEITGVEIKDADEIRPA